MPYRLACPRIDHQGILQPIWCNLDGFTFLYVHSAHDMAWHGWEEGKGCLSFINCSRVDAVLEAVRLVYLNFHINTNLTV